ncbi:unnamed protein product [Oikopleura dioica]|uniref:Uncharacterized protein n=1 Tax=Oikopleura dioica TaxID=34765 RepID=E4XSH4_OIKDI|nr:unnamed protein product [Oikopleura dioica]
MLRILLLLGISYGQSQKRLPDAIIFGKINTKVAAAGPEIHFFDRDVNYNNGNFTWYREQMPVASDDQLVIEKTPRYFVVRKAIARMKELLEQRKRDCDENLSSSAWTCKPLKLILIVREPVSRLISGFTQIQDKRLKLNKEPGPELEQEVFINGDPNQERFKFELLRRAKSLMYYSGIQNVS